LEEITRQVQQERTLRLKVLSSQKEAEEILRDQPGVGQIYEADGHLEVEFVGEDEATASLLATLVARGVLVVSFTEVSSDLEEVFLRLTKGEVA
jgi:ABC-2 type transport system ATP-binding protein